MDITKCKGTKCPIKKECYRYTAEDEGIGQAWFVEPPFKDGKCEMFWGDKSKSVWKQLKDIVK